MAAPEVLVIGDANPDLVLTGDVDPRFGQVEKLVDTASLVLGASGAIVAAGLARLGVRTALAAVIGDDVFGRFVLDELTACGVDTSWVRTDPDVASPVTVVLSAGDRAILHDPLGQRTLHHAPQVRQTGLDGDALVTHGVELVHRARREVVQVVRVEERVAIGRHRGLGADGEGVGRA